MSILTLINDVHLILMNEKRKERCFPRLEVVATMPASDEAGHNRMDVAVERTSKMLTTW